MNNYINKSTLTLLRKINAVNPLAAARYMLMMLDDDSSHARMSFVEFPDYLLVAFVWDETEEGCDYWEKVARELDEADNE